MAFKKLLHNFIKDSPIVFNRAGLSAFVKRYTTGFEDPRKLLSKTGFVRKDFAKIVSTIRTDHTWKTTKPSRHRLSDEVIVELASLKPDCVILDVGVSDGSTSLDVIEKTRDNFRHYYVTDIYFYIYALELNNITYFYLASSRTCFMAVYDRFIIYRNVKSRFFPWNWVSGYLLSKGPVFDAKAAQKINLCHPDLLNLAKTDPRVKICEWNTFEPWERNKPDIIKIANVLNSTYFKDKEIGLVVKNLISALNPDGRLLIVENREKEQWSLFKKEKERIILEDTGNGGSDITGLIKWKTEK